MKLENIKELNLPHYKHDPLSRELIIGDIVSKAEISITAEAWVFGYSKIKGNNYHFSFQLPISQHGFPGSKDQPKEFPIYVVGLVDDGKNHSLAYATSRNPHTKRINTLRLTDLEQITHIGDYKLVLKTD